MLISPAELSDLTGQVRVLDATVFLPRPPGGGPYTPTSGLSSFTSDGHIPGALFADLVSALAAPSSRFPFGIPSAARFSAGVSALGVSPSTQVVIYAQESPMWATRLWWLFRYFGFDSVSVLDGGLPAWRSAGLPVESGPPTLVPAGSFVASTTPALLATLSDIQSRPPETCLVNALAPAVFRGEGVTSYSRPGRIPGSVNSPAGSLLDPAGRFLPLPSLRSALAPLLAEPDLVIHCGGGISATVVIFALALLGRSDVRLYDGSLAEWSADPDLPLEVG
jgi:thiosulfate/3-mercaptopyruvate sulfurtransferase